MRALSADKAVRSERNTDTTADVTIEAAIHCEISRKRGREIRSQKKCLSVERPLFLSMRST